MPSRILKSCIFVLAPALSGAVAGCAHQAIVPEAKNVTVVREVPSPKCNELGKVQGSVSTVKGTIQDAIEDMKLDAARKGANFVHIESTGAMGTSISGTAYQCP